MVQFIYSQKCERCHKNIGSTTMSIFNTQMVCLDCIKKEEAHPQYQEAKEVELQETKHGNYKFPGIGLPKDL